MTKIEQVEVTLSVIYLRSALVSPQFEDARKALALFPGIKAEIAAKDAEIATLDRESNQWRIKHDDLMADATAKDAEIARLRAEVKA